jgi:CRP-like cAMP-binding protein
MTVIMSPDLISLLASLAPRPARFPPGAALFHRDDAVQVVHLVRSGTIHLRRPQADGTPLVLQRAIAGAILAEASVFSDRYHCDAVALTAAETAFIPRAALRTLLATNGAFALAWAHHLAREVQQARLQAEILALRTVSARLDAWAAWHGTLPPKGEWASLAAAIGVSPEALYREIARRRSNG